MRTRIGAGLALVGAGDLVQAAQASQAAAAQAARPGLAAAPAAVPHTPKLLYIQDNDPSSREQPAIAEPRQRQHLRLPGRGRLRRAQGPRLNDHQGRRTPYGDRHPSVGEHVLLQEQGDRQKAECARGTGEEADAEGHGQRRLVGDHRDQGHCPVGRALLGVGVGQHSFRRAVVLGHPDRAERVRQCGEPANGFGTGCTTWSDTKARAAAGGTKEGAHFMLAPYGSTTG